MMRFRYVGPEERVSLFGAEFVRGEPVAVTDPTERDGIRSDGGPACAPAGS